jgi:predicted Fe-Mo cluster-binding NifX family protein
MKIAVTATGPTLEAVVETRFGRCAYFLCIDPDIDALEAIPNPNIASGGGAGPQSAQLLADKGVSVVLTGNCGPNAFQTFGAAGIQVVTGVSGSVRDAIERFKTGRLKPAYTPSVQGHYGTGGSGGGRGMGRGRGMGKGMGMGRVGGGGGSGRRP